jgi:hypothetical protein
LNVSAGYVLDGERESLLGRGEAEPQMAPPSRRILHHAPAYNMIAINSAKRRVNRSRRTARTRSTVPHWEGPQV